MWNRDLIQSHWLGNISYLESCKIMEIYKKKAQASKELFILGMELSPCIVLGKRGDRKKDILADELSLKNKGVSVYEAPRGGQASLHSPGQLVIYPITSIENLGVKAWVNILKKVSLNWLNSYFEKPSYYKEDDPGFYTEKGKIGFLGLCIQKQISSYGLCFNVTNELDLFNFIVSCGVKSRSFDRFKEHLNKDSEQLFYSWVDSFKKDL